MLNGWDMEAFLSTSLHVTHVNCFGTEGVVSFLALTIAVPFIFIFVPGPLVFHQKKYN